MLKLIWYILVDFSRGIFDSVHGLRFIFDLDQDDEFVAVNQIKPQAPKTVMQQRREQRGLINRPAEQIMRQRVRAWKRILQCVCLNLVFVVILKSVLYVILLCLNYITEYSEYAVHFTTGFLIVPVFLFTRIVMALWFSDIAGACLRSLKLSDPPPVDIRTAVSDLLVSVLLALVFLVQSLAVVYLPLPFLASALSFIHLCLLNSLYSFEYFWASRSVSLNERVSRLERRWPYFVGFGFLLTMATTLSGNFVIDGCCFGALFPFFIISSYKANWKLEREGAAVVPVVHIFGPSKLFTDRFVTFISNHATS